MTEGPMWLRNCWQVAAFASEVQHAILPRTFLGEPVILYRTEAGDVVAMRDRCPHRLAPLSIGTLHGSRIRCGYHGLEFGPDGTCVHVPGQDRIPAAAQVRIYPLVERYKLIWIWMGQPELADAALVPDVHWLGDPNWAASTGYHHMAADYRLVTDNLLDLSHETYVHQRTIGNEAVADRPAKVSTEAGRIIRADRNMPNILPPPYFARVMDYEGPINRWQSAIYMPPGMHMTEAGVYKVGLTPADAFVGRVLHLLTPETETTAHYFWAMNRNYRLQDDELGEFIRDAVQRTLDEDKVVLELQMKAILDEQPAHFPQVAIVADAAPLQARRMLQRLVRAEREDSSALAPPVPLAADPPADRQPASAA